MDGQLNRTDKWNIRTSNKETYYAYAYYTSHSFDRKQTFQFTTDSSCVMCKQIRKNCHIRERDSTTH